MSFFSLITGSFLSSDHAKGVFTETESYEKGFSDHYEKNLKPHVESFEKSRMASLLKASNHVRIAIPVVIIIILLAIFAMDSSDYDKNVTQVVFIVALLTCSFLYSWVYKSIKNYSSSIKFHIFPNIISFFGQYQYFSICGRKVHRLKDSDIIPKYDRETSEDQIIGEYKDVKINLFETCLEKKRHTKNGTHYSTLFKGIIIDLSMNKKFNSKTIIKKDKGRIGNWMKGKFSDFENVKLEDPNFENMFEVYSKDQIEARYLLTTSFMERLLNLSESFKGQSIECSFYDNKLLMMISIKDNLFEPGSIYDSEDFVDDAKSLLKEMNMIFQIIDILKLNQNIGI